MVRIHYHPIILDRFC